MVLEVYDKDNRPVCTLGNDEALLGAFPIDSGMRIHVKTSFIPVYNLYFNNWLKI
jgi:hypothetical protein